MVWIALSKLTPFLNPVVPDSFGFAILDAQGDIQIHSVMDRSLQENLFRECENDQELKSAVWARRSQWVTTRYYGDKYRMYLSPIKGTPFSAVTFYNAHMVHVVASDIVSAWLFDSILYGFAYVVLLLAVELVAPGYRADWLWPSRSASIVPLYWWVIPFLAIAAVYSLAVLPALDGWPKVAMTAVIPASIVALLCLTFGNAGTPLATWDAGLPRSLPWREASLQVWSCGFSGCTGCAPDPCLYSRPRSDSRSSPAVASTGQARGSRRRARESSGWPTI